MLQYYFGKLKEENKICFRKSSFELLLQIGWLHVAYTADNYYIMWKNIFGWKKGGNDVMICLSNIFIVRVSLFF